MNWHYVDQGKQAGPVTEEHLAELFRAGKIEAGTLVWRAGMADWIPYGETITEAKPGQPPVNAAAPSAGPHEAVCAECKNIFPADEMIRHGAAYICAGCKPVFMQKLSEGAPVLAAGEFRYAGFWVRFAAKFVDGLIIGLPLMVVYFIVVFPIITNARGQGSPPNLGLLPLLLQFGMIFLNMVYQIFFLGKYGATPGKMACKLKVVTADGGKITYGRAAGRFFAELLSGMVCYIGYLMVAFDNPQKRALHDHICNTRVIQK